MNIKNKLKQKAILKKYIGRNGSGKEEYEDEIEIRVLLDYRTKLTSTKAGNMITTKGSVMTLHKIRDNDVLIFDDIEFKINGVHPEYKKTKLLYYEGDLI